jgi:hypothetical protein
LNVYERITVGVAVLVLRDAASISGLPEIDI